MVVPAVALGAFVIFGIGYLLTSAVMTKSARKTRTVSTLYRGTWREVKRPDEATEKHIDEMSKLGGGIAVILLVILLVVAPWNWTTLIWTALTVAGIIFGLFTFVIQEPRSTSEIGKRHTRVPSPGVASHVKDKLYQNLLTKCRNDKNLADRLIEYERKRAEYASEEELIRNAIERWERDKR